MFHKSFSDVLSSSFSELICNQINSTMFKNYMNFIENTRKQYFGMLTQTYKLGTLLK